MSHESDINQAERRQHPRHAPEGRIHVMRVLPNIPLSDAEVVDTSLGGLALRTRVALQPGDRLSFYLWTQAPPILGEVLAREEQEDGWFLVHCRCLVGGFGTT